MPKFVNFEKKQKNTFTHTSYIHHRLMSCFVWKLVDRFSDNCIVSFNSTSVAVLGDTNCFRILSDSSVRLNKLLNRSCYLFFKNDTFYRLS